MATELPPLTDIQVAADSDAAALQVANNALQQLPDPATIVPKALGGGLKIEEMTDFYTAYYATGAALISATLLCAHQIKVTPSDPGNLQQHVGKLATQLGLLRTTEETMRLSHGSIRPPTPEVIRNAQYLAAGLGKLQEKDLKVASVLSLVDTASKIVTVVTA